MTDATLVLEGGANRGVFTSGVLDCLMEQDLYLSRVIGVSAGACNGLDYVSKQPGRSRDCSIHKNKADDYFSSPIEFLQTKSILNMDRLFNRYPNELYPFDYETFFASDICFEITVTNCETGKAEYLKANGDKQQLMTILKASCSMPVLCPIVYEDGTPYLDGGTADPVPVARALTYGEKVVVVLTRNPGYRKSGITRAAADLYRIIFKDYPNIARALIRRNALYNRQMQLIEQLEQEKKIFVLRPQIPAVSRMERDHDKLMEFCEHGYNLMKESYKDLQSYLES